MRKLNLLLFFSLIVSVTQAQFINNGATVVIQAGATLRIETDFINNAGGTVTNNGTLEVKGDFTNAATFTSDAGTTVRFIGDTDSKVTSGGAVFQNVEMAKSEATGQVTLLDDFEMIGNLSFTGTDNNKILLGGHNFTMAPSSTVVTDIDHETNGYIVTNGTGQLVKGINANGTLIHEVGDIDNYTLISHDVTGSGYTNATLGARVTITDTEDKVSGTTDYIDRDWLVSASGIDDYENTMTGTYVAGDATGNQSLIKGSTFHNMDGHFTDSDNAALQIIGSTDEDEVIFSGQNFFGKVNLMAFLQGPYNVNTGLMNTSLNSTTPANNILEQFALNSPYTDAPASAAAGFFLDNPDIVDWVRLELRNPAAPSTSTSNKVSAFIKNDGSIVGLGGVSFPKIPNVLPTSVVVLSHRNHLAIRTPNAGLDVVEPNLHDFSTGLGQAYTNPAITTNDAMRNESGTFQLWAGDVNQDGVVKYNLGGNDRVLIFNAIEGINQNATIDGYYSEDVNLNGQVKYNLGGNDRVILFNNIGGINQNTTISHHN